MIKFPFFDAQQMNLDWLLTTVQKILSFLPINSGVAGDVLQRGTDGAVWQPIAAVSMDIHSLTADAPDPTDELPIYDTTLQGNYKVTVQDILDLVPAGVSSVNGQTGAVTLSIPTDTSDLTNTAGYVDAAGAAAAAPVQSVNGQTGAVTITVPTDVSDLVNDSGFVDAAGAAAAAPVQSVNGQTGAVTIPTGSSPVLLWTNGSPANSFSSQNIALDLSGYSFIIIESAMSAGFTCKLDIFKVPTMTPPVGYAVYDCIFGMYFSGTGGALTKRNLTITTTSIQFEDGVLYDTYNNSNTTNNTLCRPLYVWGIK